MRKREIERGLGVEGERDRERIVGVRKREIGRERVRELRETEIERGLGG